MIRVFLVDDHPVIRSGLRTILGDQADLRVVGEASNAEECLAGIVRTEFDVLVLDVSLPDRSGMELLREIKIKKSDAQVLIYSRFPKEQFAIRAFRAGARGFVNKLADPAQLLDAIRRVGAGGRFVSAAVAELLSMELRRQRFERTHDDLSEREFEVFLLLISGETPTSIAEKLGLSIKTVSTHRTRIMEKLGVDSFADLMRYAIAHHIEPE